MIQICRADYGQVIERFLVDQSDVAIDISTASSKNFYLKKPDGTVLTKTALFTTTGTDGGLYYVLAAGDIDADGGWKFQFSTVISGGQITTPWEPLQVGEKFV